MLNPLSTPETMDAHLVPPVTTLRVQVLKYDGIRSQNGPSGNKVKSAEFAQHKSLDPKTKGLKAMISGTLKGPDSIE